MTERRATAEDPPWSSDPDDVSFDRLLSEIRACRACAAHLPHGPRPVVQADPHAAVLVIGQAPSRSVHRSGVPWDDRSGDRLRAWLGLAPDTFYDPTRVALVPVAFCYPGSVRGGDLPPRPECRPRWHHRLVPRLRDVELCVVVGRHALRGHAVGASRGLTETVRGWRSLPESLLVLPHPSPRNNRWLSANPWFESEVLPVARDRVARVLGHQPAGDVPIRTTPRAERRTHPVRPG